MTWYVYIIQCADETYYTGITRNITRRIEEHNTSNSVSAKYTRTRRPVQLVYRHKMKTRGEALRREAEIKRLSRELKKKLILSR